MTRIISEIRNLQSIQKELKHPRYVSGRVSGVADILKVRQFCFRVYSQRGEIEPELLNEQGVLGPDKDSYAEHSVYFVVRPKGGGLIIAASRLIMPLAEPGVHSLQVDARDLNQSVREYLESHGAAIAEPSSFAKMKGAPSVATLYLIREMLHYSLNNGITHWLIALNPHIESTYRRRFGPALTKLGDRVTSKVDLDGRRPVNVPYLVDVRNALDYMEMGSAFYKLLAAPTIRDFMRANPRNAVVSLRSTPKEEPQLSRRA